MSNRESATPSIRRFLKSVRKITLLKSICLNYHLQSIGKNYNVRPQELHIQEKAL